MRPLTRLLELGGDDDLTPADKLHASVSYDYLSFFRTSTVTNTAASAGGPLTLDYDRHRTDPKWHRTVGTDARYQHAFAEPGHELDTEFKYEWHREIEDNRYENVYRRPVARVCVFSRRGGTG